MSAADPFPRVLCVACSPAVFARLDHAFRYSGLHVLSAATRDKGVAVCVAEVIAVAVIDGESIRGEACSVAKALKMVRPSLRIILLEERKRLSEVPDGIDAVVPMGATEQLLKTIQELLNPGQAESKAAS
jgi:ActR/RegA family two-component response regulator